MSWSMMVVRSVLQRRDLMLAEHLADDVEAGGQRRMAERAAGVVGPVAGAECRLATSPDW
jgi:hypothetical protein